VWARLLKSEEIQEKQYLFAVEAEKKGETNVKCPWGDSNAHLSSNYGDSGIGPERSALIYRDVLSHGGCLDIHRSQIALFEAVVGADYGYLGMEKILRFVRDLKRRWR
jgi:hypothetical protein